MLALAKGPFGFVFVWATPLTRQRHPGSARLFAFRRLRCERPNGHV